MKCTDCYKDVRPVVAIDIDGTLGEYHLHMIDLAEMYFGRPFPHTYIGEYQEFSDWFAQFGVTKADYRQLKLAYRQGGWKRFMPVFPGAWPLLTSLRSWDVEVWLCTSRPYLRLDNVDPDTREWLERNGLEYDGLIYGEDKYERLVATVGKERIIGVLDDLPEMIDAAEALGLPAYQIARQHNQHITAHRGIRCGSLSAARDTFLKGAAEWQADR